MKTYNFLSDDMIQYQNATLSYKLKTEKNYQIQ